MGENFYPTRSERVSNMLRTTGATLSETPSKLYDEVAKDLQDPKKMLTLAAVSTGVGYGTTALLAKYPKVGGVAAAGLCGYQLYRYGSETINFLSEAGDASTDYQRRMLAERASYGLARESAMLIEGTPGALAGGYLATRTFGTPPLYKAIGRAADKAVGKPVSKASTAAKEFVSEQWAFRGPGNMDIPPNIFHKEGTVNVLELSEMLAARHPWKGVETGRSVDLLKHRISKPITGDKTTFELGFRDKPGRILFHTHGPDRVSGARPGRFDLIATHDLGIIQRGGYTGFYVGQGREFNAALTAGTKESFAPKLQALFLDPKRETAFVLESVWQPKLSSWQPTTPKFVDYKEARSTLSNLNITKPWQAISKIPASTPTRGRDAVDVEIYTWMQSHSLK